MELFFRLLPGLFIIVHSQPKLHHMMWWFILTLIPLAFAPPSIWPQRLWLVPFPMSYPIPLAWFCHTFHLLILGPLPPLHIDAVESPPLPRHPLITWLIILIQVFCLHPINFTERIWKIDLPLSLLWSTSSYFGQFTPHYSPSILQPTSSCLDLSLSSLNRSYSSLTFEWWVDGWLSVPNYWGF